MQLQKLLWYIGTAVFLLGCALLASLPILGTADVVFPFNDGSITAMLAERFDYPGILLRYWNAQVFFGQDLRAAVLNSNAVWETLMGPVGFRRWGVAVVILWAGLAGYWSARRFDRSPMASAATGLVLGLCGLTTTFAASGLTSRGFTLGWAAISIGLLESGRRKNQTLSYLLAGGALGMALSDTPDAGILVALGFALYFVCSHLSGVLKNTKSWKPVGIKFGLFVGGSLLLALQAIYIMTATQAGGPDGGGQMSDEQRYEWATQWSVPPAETWSMIANDYHGASSRVADNLYWGATGRSAGWEATKQGFRSFRLSGYAIGVVPFMLILLLVVMACRRKLPFDSREKMTVITLGSLTLLFLALSWGKYFPLYRIFYALPKMDLIRNPDKWLVPFTITFSLLTAYGVDALRAAYLNRKEQPSLGLAGWISLGFWPVLALLGLFNLLSSKVDFVNRLTLLQFTREQAENAFGQAMQANLEAVLVGGLFIGVMVFLFRQKTSLKSSQGALVYAGLALLIAIPMVRATGPYFFPYNHKSLLQADVLTEALDEHASNSRVKIIPDQLLNHWRTTTLRVRDYRIFDPISVRSMNKDDQTFIQFFQQNPLGLWRLGGMRHVVANRSTANQLLQTGAFKELLSFGANQKGDRVFPVAVENSAQAPYALLEFSQALPLVSLIPNVDIEKDEARVLQQLTQPGFNPTQRAFIQNSDRVIQGGGGTVEILEDSSVETVLKVNSTAESLLLRLEKYHPAWKVRIDGKKAKLLQANVLFQGVLVPEGEHTVTFTFKPSKLSFLISLVGRAALMAGFLTLLMISLKRPAIQP